MAPAKPEMQPIPPPKSRVDRLRVLLVDDHPVVLAGLKSFLRDAVDVEITASAANTEEALGRAEHLRPDVFFVTIGGATRAPAELVKKLRARFPEVAVVVMALDAAHTKELVAAGAFAVLERTAGKEAVLAALGQLRPDEDTGSRRVLALRDSAPPPPSSGSGSLSRRELQVLTLIADGHTNKQIADELGISVRTVETHRERLMRKLNVQGTAALTKAAIALGLVSAKA